MEKWVDRGDTEIRISPVYSKLLQIKDVFFLVTCVKLIFRNFIVTCV
jgi:hypothetical protein